MEMKVRALLSSIVVLMMASLVGCGHYTCGATFGNSSCTSTGSTGISQSGGNTEGKAAAFEFFMNGGTLSGAILDTSLNFSLIPNFVSPPQASAAVGGMLVVQKKWLYLSENGSLNIEAYSINGTTGALTAVAGSPFPSLDTNAITADPAGKFLFLCAGTDSR